MCRDLPCTYPEISPQSQQGCMKSRQTCCIPTNVYTLTSFPGPHQHITYGAGNEATGQPIIIHDSLIPSLHYLTTSNTQIWNPRLDVTCCILQQALMNNGIVLGE